MATKKILPQFETDVNINLKILNNTFKIIKLSFNTDKAELTVFGKKKNTLTLQLCISIKFK